MLHKDDGQFGGAAGVFGPDGFFLVGGEIFEAGEEAGAEEEVEAAGLLAADGDVEWGAVWEGVVGLGEGGGAGEGEGCGGGDVGD